MYTRSLAAALAIAIAFTAPASAVAEESGPCGPHEDECSREPDEANLLRHCCYVNRDGHEEHAPSPLKPGAPPPVRASALCGDGYYSFSEHGAEPARVIAGLRDSGLVTLL